MSETKKSLPVLDMTPELEQFAAREFPESHFDAPDSNSRRRFMQLMGASLAFAGCRWDKENVMPETRRPQGHIPGKAKHYATVMELSGVGLGLLVTSNDGRPTKIEGNPNHPTSKGATDLFAQASVLELYDPDRSQRPVQRQGTSAENRSWDEANGFLRSHFEAARATQGAGVAILSEATSSPTALDLKAKLLTALPQAKWYEYEALSHDTAREGARLAFGKPFRTHYQISKAKIVACLDADLVKSHPEDVRLVREFAERRKPDGEWMSRWYAVESFYSQTGASVDHRLPIRSAQVKPFLLALEALVAQGLGQAAPGPTVSGGFLQAPETVKFLKALAADLVANQKASVVAVGANQPADVHAVALRLNGLLGNLGETVLLTAEQDADRPTHNQAIGALTQALNANQVQTLLVLGGNPAFTAPADLAFASAIGKAKTSIHLGLYEDETAALCTWHIPRAHYLEAWGDTRAWDGTISIAQPLIAPLYQGKSVLEVLAIAAGDSETDGQALVRRTFNLTAPLLDADKKWRVAIHDGVVEGSAFAPELPALVSFNVDAVPAGELSESGVLAQNLELVFVPDNRLYDGRFANNGWLQELPDFLTKLTWDNALLVNPTTAKELGLKTEGMVTLTVDGRSLDVPVFAMPGQARYSMTLAVGGGRTRAGHVAGFNDVTEPVGFNTYTLRSSKAPGFVGGVKVAALDKKYKLATTQDKPAEMDTIGTTGIQGRLGMLIREAKLEKFKEEPDFAQHEGLHHPPLKALWAEHEYNGHKWGMAIDLNACTGCGACMVGCQAENNIPVVGKEQVLKNREMHWLRLDRYFTGNPDNPEVRGQPVTCQQCENAPCEAVCPVGATVHSSEGLNDMAYNRCIGTRYCSNNCPYKVRRFNYFNYHLKFKEEPQEMEVLKMAFNPQVTVRARGVMEKCTYCVQRIQNVKIVAKNERRAIKDGEITTACAQACAARAITFGDLNDEAAQVTKLHKDQRSYALLDELFTKPRTQYLAKVTNPNPELKA